MKRGDLVRLTLPVRIGEVIMPADTVMRVADLPGGVAILRATSQCLLCGSVATVRVPLDACEVVADD